MNWELEGDGRFGCACFLRQTESHVAIFLHGVKSHSIIRSECGALLVRECNERNFLELRVDKAERDFHDVVAHALTKIDFVRGSFESSFA